MLTFAACCTWGNPKAGWELPRSSAPPTLLSEALQRGFPIVAVIGKTGSRLRYADAISVCSAVFRPSLLPPPPAWDGSVLQVGNVGASDQSFTSLLCSGSQPQETGYLIIYIALCINQCILLLVCAHTSTRIKEGGKKTGELGTNIIHNNTRKRLNTVNMTANSNAGEKQRQKPRRKQFKPFD